MTYEELPPPSPVNPITLAMLDWMAASLLAGEQSTALDVAAFVAYPFGVAAAATAGAAEGVRRRG